MTVLICLACQQQHRHPLAPLDRTRCANCGASPLELHQEHCPADARFPIAVIALDAREHEAIEQAQLGGSGMIRAFVETLTGDLVMLRLDRGEPAWVWTSGLMAGHRLKKAPIKVLSREMAALEEASGLLQEAIGWLNESRLPQDWDVRDLYEEEPRPQ